MKPILLLVALATAVFLGLRENSAAKRAVSTATVEAPKGQFLEVRVPRVPSTWDAPKLRVEHMRDGDAGYVDVPFHIDGRLCLNDRTEWHNSPSKYSSYLTNSNGKFYVWLNKKGAEAIRTELKREYCTPVFVTGIECSICPAGAVCTRDSLDPSLFDVVFNAKGSTTFTGMTCDEVTEIAKYGSAAFMAKRMGAK